MSQNWPVGRVKYPHDQLVQMLLDQASMHARRALQLSDDRDLPLQAISIGTSVELLAKAILASINYGFVGGQTFSAETVLTLDGLGPHDHGLPVMSSVMGKEALKRLNQVRKEFTNLRKYEIVFTVRNSALHMGMATPEANRAALKVMIEASEKLLSLREGPRDAAIESYWGADNIDLVSALRDEARGDVRLAFETKRAAAKARFATLVRAIGQSRRSEVLAQLAAQPDVELTQEARSFVCPACENVGWLVYDEVRHAAQFEYDGDETFNHGGAWYVEREGVAAYFECGVCRLFLDDESEMELAGMPLQISLSDDEATDVESGVYDDYYVDRERDPD